MMSKYLFSFIFYTCVAGILCQVYKASGGSQSNGNNNNHVVDVIETQPEPEAIKNDFITQTVYGFLDFTTTIGNTVMVFSPQSAPPEGEKKQITSAIQTKPSTIIKKNIEIQPSKTHKGDDNSLSESKKSIKNSKVVINSIVQSKNEGKLQATKNPILSTVVQVRSKDESAVKNNLAEPEYDYLSKQPAEIIDETYKIINLSPTIKTAPKPRPSPKKEKENPTGLVTKLGGTIIKDGLTTVHETSVIGTYINGKYAQVLQSTSRILKPGLQANLDNNNIKIRPTNTHKILKTIGPQHGKLKPQLEPTPTQQEESSLPLEVLFSAPSGVNVKVTRRPSLANGIRPKFRNKIFDEQESIENSQQPKNYEKNRHTTSRPNFKNRPVTTTTTSEPPTTRRRTGFRPFNSSPKLIRPKSEQNSNPVGIPKVKLPRTQGRWSYKTTPKPRIAIRKQATDDEEKAVSTPETVITSEAAITSTTEEKSLSPPVIQKKMSVSEGVPVDDELDSSESEQVNSTSDQSDQVDDILPAETLNVEISTVSDLNDIYYEIATIKTPYTFQVGTMKNTRFITVTSTLKKSFATVDPTISLSSPTEPLTENILANTGAAYESSLPLDSSIATLPAITLESGQMTPPLETLTETFTTTQTLLKTYLLPVVAAGSGNTTRHTLVQTYNIARMVTAIKTLPPSEIYQFIPSKTLNEFNSKLDEAGSELHLELDFGDDENDDEDIPKRILVPSSDNSDLEVFKQAPKASSGRTEASTSSPESQLTPEQAQQLALLKYFNQAAPGAQVITTSRPIIVLETLYESHVIPLVNNGNTVYSTLSRPVATVPKTSYEVRTSTISPPLVPPVPPVPIFPPQQQFTITSAPFITQTLATVSDSRILKLTFGAKTAYTTLFSTRVVPTEITTYVTTTIPVQQTVPSYPGYFGGPVGYPAFPFVG